METKEVRRIRLIGRICELIERSGGATFNVNGDNIKISGIPGKNPYNRDGTEIFVNDKKSSWDDFDFEVLEEVVEIIHGCNLGITY